MSPLQNPALPPRPRTTGAAPCVRLYLFRPYGEDPKFAADAAERPRPDPLPGPSKGSERPA